MSESKTDIARRIIADMIPDAEMLKHQENNTAVFAGDLVQLAIEHSYHDLWSRDDIDRRTRSIVTVSMMVGAGEHAELAIHTAAAIRNGVSIGELAAIVTHATGYVGFPRAAAARQTMVKALMEADLLK